MKTKTLKEIRGEAEAKRKELKSIFDEAGPDMDMAKVKSIDGDSTAKVEAIKAINDELDDLVKQGEPLEEELAVLTRAKARADQLGEPEPHPGHQAPGAKGGDAPRQKSLGELFTEGEVGTARKGREVEFDDVDLKTLMTTSAGWAPETIRTGRLVESAQRPPQVIDLIPSGSTSQAAVVYMAETTFTNNAIEKAEGAAFGEAALALTEVSEPVRKIPVFLPVTDEQLEDVAGIQGYINRRLTAMIYQRLDGQVVVGDGTAPNISGFLDRAGIQTQAKGTDPVFDAFLKAMTKVRVTGRANPTGSLIHPNDWQDVRLTRTADGVYILGNPADPGPERLFGLPVVATDAITEGTGLVGDFAAYSELTMRRGIELKVSDSHGTYFVEGKQAVRADLRAALCVFREAAFASVTGI